jgi:hypothetical protein
VLATLVFRTALFAVVFVVSVAFVTGVATQRFKDGVLAGPARWQVRDSS